MSVISLLVYHVLMVFLKKGCQSYVRQIAKSITAADLASLPTSTSMVVIGCGSPDLIDFYSEVTGWPFAIYTDPTNRLHDVLGFHKGMSIVSDPGTYIQKSMPQLAIESIGQITRHFISTWSLRFAGGGSINGGELFFQPIHVGTVSGKTDEGEKDGRLGKQVTWCNRMRGNGDHAELPELMEVLGFPEPACPEDVSMGAWTKVLSDRRGAKMQPGVVNACGC